MGLSWLHIQMPEGCEDLKGWGSSADIRDPSLSFPKEKFDSIQQIFTKQPLSRSLPVRRVQPH